MSRLVLTDFQDTAMRAFLFGEDVIAALEADDDRDRLAIFDTLSGI